MITARPPVVLLMGATASGKTALAMALSDRFPVSLISVDSVMVYRGLDIGSAKPDRETLRRYPHALVDICDPAAPYSVADFLRDSSVAIQAAHRRGRLPVLVGGTSMYFKALVHGLGDMPAADPQLRRRLEVEASEIGWPALHARLTELDPVAAAGIPPANRQRIQRALEVYELTGRPISSFWRSEEGSHDGRDWDRNATEFEKSYALMSYAIDPGSRELLYERINQRFDDMLEQGFIDEVRGLRARGDLTPDLPAIRAVGYRQVWNYLAGDYDYAQLRIRGQAATRQLAKRQWTWMRRWDGLNWLEGLPNDSLVSWVSRIENDLRVGFLDWFDVNR